MASKFPGMLERKSRKKFRGRLSAGWSCAAFKEMPAGRSRSLSIKNQAEVQMRRGHLRVQRNCA